MYKIVHVNGAFMLFVKVLSSCFSELCSVYFFYDTVHKIYFLALVKITHEF